MPFVNQFGGIGVDPAMLAWLQREWNANRLTRPIAAIVSLKNNPRGFLRRYPILSTFDCSAHGVTTAYLTNDGNQAQRPGSRLGTMNFHTTESFNLTKDTGLMGGGESFRVHGVYTGQSSVAPLWYLLDGTGPDVMLTAKLTGCTFVARAVPGTNNVEVTHLQPHGETGLALNQRMRGVAGQKAYGRLKYDINNRAVNIVGVRRNGQWKIYAQKIHKHNKQIRSLHRIWPV